MTAVTLTLNAFSFENSDLFKTNKQDKKFANITVALLIFYVIFGIAVFYIEKVEVPREVKEQLPPQLTRILLQEKVLPVPEVKKEEPIPEIEKEPEPEPEPKIEKPKEPPKTKREAAKEKAKSSGLAAMKDELFSIRDAFEVKPQTAPLTQSNNTAAEVVKPKLLAAKANEQSQNIASANTTKTVVSDDVSSHKTQTIRLAEEEILADTLAQADSADEGNSASKFRSEMKLRQTLEANKARLYSLYNRALRKEPFLKGKVLFEIEIQPDGSVSKVSIQSSELANEALEARLLTVLRTINFGAEDVSVMTTVWAVEFLPR